MAQLLASLDRTTVEPEVIELVLVVDADDASYDALPAGRIAVKHHRVRPQLSMGSLYGQGCQAANGDWIMLLHDDVVAGTPGWDRCIRDLTRLYSDKIALIRIAGDPDHQTMRTFPVVSRAFCGIAGGICPEEYNRYRVDDHFLDVFRLLSLSGHDRVIDAADLRFHPAGLDADRQSGEPARGGPILRALDDEIFESLLPGRQQVALKLLDYIEATRTGERRAILANRLLDTTDSVTLRRPEFVTRLAADSLIASPPPRLTVGIVSADLKSERAKLTIEAVKRFTTDFDLVLLDRNLDAEVTDAQEMNRILSICRTDLLVLMNDGIIVGADWVDGLLRAVAPDVAVVTPVHRDRQGSTSYAGLVLSPDGDGRYSPIHEIPAGPVSIQAPCSAMMLIDLRKCGHMRFAEAYSGRLFDVDYGLRIWEAGYRVVQTPHTLVTRIDDRPREPDSEGASAAGEADRQRFVRQWATTGRWQRLIGTAPWQDDPTLRKIAEFIGQVDRLLARDARPIDRAALETMLRGMADFALPRPALRDWAKARILARYGCPGALDLRDENLSIALIHGHFVQQVVIDPDRAGFRIILHQGDYYAVPATEPDFDPVRVRSGLAGTYWARDLETLLARIRRGPSENTTQDAPPAPPRLLNQDYKGFNLLEHDGFYAVRQAQGAVNGADLAAGRYPGMLKASSIEALRSDIDAVQPRLMAAAYHGFSIHQAEAVYGVPCGTGAFDVQRARRGQYHCLLIGRSIDEVRAVIDRLGPRLAEAGRRGFNIVEYDQFYALPQRAGPFDVDRVGSEAYLRLPRSPDIEIVRNAIDQLPLSGRVRLLGIRQAVSQGLLGSTRPSARRPADAVEPGARTATGTADTWLKRSPSKLVEAGRDGFDIYELEYKFFAVPHELGTFDYAAFRADGRLNRCLIGQSRDEAHMLIAGTLTAAGPRRLLVFGPPDGIDPATLLGAASTPETWHLVPQGRSTGDRQIELPIGDASDIGRHLLSPAGSASLVDLAGRGFTDVAIRWHGSAVWRDNSLEDAAIRIAPSVHIVGPGGETRRYVGEGGHRLLYNKAYLASLFSRISLPTGKQVLEVGCSDGMVCDIMAMLGAREITGVDIMETTGCCFPRPEIRYLSGDAHALPFEDDSFDLIVSIATFEHLRHPVAALAEIVRVLRPGGHAYVQAGPLYHSPFGHHMFGYFDDMPWIHLRMTPEEIAARVANTDVAARIEKDHGRGVAAYVRDMLSPDHVNGLRLADYRLEALGARADVTVLFSSVSKEGESLLSHDLEQALSAYDEATLTQHGFEVLLRKKL